MLITKAKVAIHQVEGFVYCDAHDKIHAREANICYEDETGRTRCNANSWRPVFTTDSVLGVL